MIEGEDKVIETELAKTLSNVEVCRNKCKEIQGFDDFPTPHSLKAWNLQFHSMLTKHITSSPEVIIPTSVFKEEIITPDFLKNADEGVPEQVYYFKISRCKHLIAFKCVR